VEEEEEGFICYQNRTRRVQTIIQKVSTKLRRRPLLASSRQTQISKRRAHPAGEFRQHALPDAPPCRASVLTGGGARHGCGQPGAHAGRLPGVGCRLAEMGLAVTGGGGREREREREREKGVGEGREMCEHACTRTQNRTHTRERESGREGGRATERQRVSQRQKQRQIGREKTKRREGGWGGAVEECAGGRDLRVP